MPIEHIALTSPAGVQHIHPWTRVSSWHAASTSQASPSSPHDSYAAAACKAAAHASEGFSVLNIARPAHTRLLLLRCHQACDGCGRAIIALQHRMDSGLRSEVT